MSYRRFQYLAGVISGKKRGCGPPHPPKRGYNVYPIALTALPQGQLGLEQGRRGDPGSLRLVDLHLGRRAQIDGRVGGETGEDRQGERVGVAVDGVPEVVGAAGSRAVAE